MPIVAVNAGTRHPPRSCSHFGHVRRAGPVFCRRERIYLQGFAWLGKLPSVRLSRRVPIRPSGLLLSLEYFAQPLSDAHSFCHQFGILQAFFFSSLIPDFLEGLCSSSLAEPWMLSKPPQARERPRIWRGCYRSLLPPPAARPPCVPPQGYIWDKYSSP